MKFLSEVVKESNYPPSKQRMKFISWTLFYAPFIVSVLITIGFFYLNTFNCFIYSTTNSNLPLNANSLLKDSLTITFSIIAIIIPINLLIISAITSRNPLFVVNYIIKRTRPLETVIIILFFLFLNIVTYFIFYLIISNFDKFAENFFYQIIIYSSIFFSLFPVFQASLLVYRTTKLLNEKILYKSIRNEITNDLILSVGLDERSKETQKFLGCELSKLGIELRDNNKIPVQNISSIKFKHKMGFNDYINGINLREYKKFKEKYGKCENKKIGILVIPKPRMSVDSYIEFYTDIVGIKSIKSSFENLFTIEKLNLKPKFDELKDAIIDSIKRNEESKLERLNETYFGFLLHYVSITDKYGLKMSYKEILDSKIQYRSLRHLCYDLTDIIREASKSRNERMLEIFALEIFKISQKAIAKKDYHILKILMKNTRLIYDYSVNNNNKNGKLISVKYTIKMIICLDNPYQWNLDENQIIPNICQGYENVLNEIIKKSKDNNDYDDIRLYVQNKYIKNNILKSFLLTKFD